MAENRIRIEVDYDKAVAKVEDLRIKFEDLGTKVTATRNRIQKAVLGTTDAIDGSVKALMREKGAWQEVQSSLSTTNAQYRVYQAEIDKIDAQIAKLTDTRKREEIALKNSAAGIQQQIALIKEEQANRKLSNTQYQVMQEEIDRLQAKYNSLTNTIRSGTIASFDAQIAKLREEQRTIATSREQVERYEQQIEKLRIRKHNLTGETINVSKASQSFSSSAGAAGATVTEFGRTIGDLPFGLMGITNNIQQLSQQFVDLQAKSGGAGAALRSVMRTMMGPAGFVVLINIATSALLYFTRQKEQATKKTEEFNESLLLELKAFRQLKNIYEATNTSLENREAIIKALAVADESYAKAINDAGDDEEKRNKITEKYLKLRDALNEAEQTRNEIAEADDENKDTWYRKTTQEILTAEERARVEDKLAEAREKQKNASDAEFFALGTTINQLQQKIKVDDDLRAEELKLANAIIAVTEAQDDLNEVLGESPMQEYADSIRDINRQVAIDSQELESQQIATRIQFLVEDIKNTEENSKERYRLQVELYQANVDLEKALNEERNKAAEENKKKKEEADEKEKDRLESLAELNQKYLDDLETQFDDYGFKRLEQQERQAIAEAKSLGASVGVLLNIQKYYEGERQKIINKATEEVEESNKKSAEKRSKELQKSLKEQFQTEIESMKSQVEMMNEVFSNFGNVLDELGNISQSRFERQIGQLNEQRDIIRTNDALTKEEKEQQLTELQLKENEIQRKRIKAERDMFTLKQGIVLAEMVMKQRAFVQEQIMMAQMTAALAKQAGTNIALTAAEETAEASMSIGTFMKQLGPWGIAAFALSIGGVIASIVSARRKAQAEIAGLSDAPISLGGGGSAAAAPASPAFNVVGASAQNQLAAAIAGQESQPVKAYVVSSDVSTAQELDRKIVEGASI